MQVLKSILFIFLFSHICASDLYAQGSEKKVLFIGNSYTYFWNLPQTVEAMAESKQIYITAIQSTAGGANLGQHWNYKKGLTTKDKIREGSYDYIVLQDHSMRAVNQPDSLLHYGKLFGDLVKERGAQALLYLTWAREWDPYMQDVITDKYYELAEEINARIVPVGLAWKRALVLRPGLELYDQDGSHPSPLGAYLSACVFYGVITGESPIGLPERVITKDQYGDKIYLNIQSANDALFCQKVAEEVLRLTPD